MWVFILMPILWYLFVYILYIGGHKDIDSGRQRCTLILYSPLYMLAM